MRRMIGRPRPEVHDKLRYPRTFYERTKPNRETRRNKYKGRNGPIPLHIHFSKAHLRRWTHFNCAAIYSWNLGFLRRTGVRDCYQYWLRVKRAYSPRTTYIGKASHELQCLA